MVYYKMLFTVDIKKTPSMNRALCNVYQLYRSTGVTSFFFFFMEEWGVSMGHPKGVPSSFFSFCKAAAVRGAGGRGGRGRAPARGGGGGGVDGSRIRGGGGQGPGARRRAGQTQIFLFTNVTRLYVLVLRKKTTIFKFIYLENDCW